MNILCSKIRNHVQWIYWEIKYEDYKNHWSLLKIRNSSMILTHRAVMTVPTRRDSDELCNDSRNLLTLSTILRKGIEKIESEEPLQSIPISCFSVRARQNIQTVESVLCLWLTLPWVLGLVLKAWQFRVISPRRCICQNSLTKRNFRARSWISEQKFAQRRRISRSSVKSWQKDRGKILTRIGRLKNIFSGGLVGLVRKETIVTRMPRDAVRLWQTDVKQSKGQSCD